jgi:hypothetical protein
MPPQQGDSLLGFIDHVFDFRSHFPLLCLGLLQVLVT